MCRSIQLQMEIRIVLCCLIGVIAAAPSSPGSTSQRYDSIVVGLGSAGATAAAALARAGRRVLALEARALPGGRVHTAPFGDGVVELGAEWIHGDQNNRVYDLAIAHKVPTVRQAEHLEPYRSDGGDLNVTLIKELLEVYTEISQNPTDVEPLGTYVTKKLMEYITEKTPDVLNDQDFITEFFAFADLITDNYEGSNSWNDVTTISRYEELGGHQLTSWHRNGYKTFFEIMLNTYNNDTTGLPNLDIKLGTEVTLITTPQYPNEKVLVQCKDGSSYEAENVIVTVSLGVLKAQHSSLFSPPLPKDKQTAIEKISIGVVDKVVLSFDKPWWPVNTSFVGFIWKGKDKNEVGQADRWTTKVYGASRSMGSSNTLTFWTSGEVAKEVETLPEDVVKRKCVELLQRFMGNKLKITVPEPTALVRSYWHSNPYTRGSYSFDNVLTPQYPAARAWLGAPLTDSAGAPRVLFAGEATNLIHFSTVHGASETGHREAMRILTNS